MRIGLIDVDGHNFPNLPLMKLSAWHKKNGDSVEWYEPLFHSIGEPFDIVYMSKVFSFTPDYEYFVNSKCVIRGGTGYAIYQKNGKECYEQCYDAELPYEVEHMYPDYSIYFNDDDFVYDEKTGECLGLSKKEREKRNTAYGFLTRGCPRGCEFCIIAGKEGKCSYKVADLSEFWNGQKNIELCDPNMFACKDWKELAWQLIDSGAYINFNQGCDIRIMTREKIEYIRQMKIKTIHFAWDRYEDKEVIIPKFKMFKEITNWDKRKLIVYILTNFDTTHKQDLERIYTLRELGYWPYVMIYEKEKLPKKHITRKLQRWVNMRSIFETVYIFDDYLKTGG